MKAGAPLPWRCYGARGRPASWIVERSSGRIPWLSGGDFGAQDQGAFSAARTSSEIDAGQCKHQLVRGRLGRFGQRRQKPQELTALGETQFGIVG